MREELKTRMIHLYGFENPAVIDFFRLCEKTDGMPEFDKLLKAMVEIHEAYPLTNA